MKEIGKNSMYVLLSQIPSNLFGILVGVMVTRILGAEGRGIYFIFQANSQFFLLFLGLSINAGITYFISSKKIQLDKLYGLIICILSFSIVSVVVLLVVISNLSIDAVIPDSYNSFWFLSYLGIVFLLQLTSSIFNGILAGFKQFKVISSITLYTSIFNIILFAVLFSYHKFIDEVYLNEVFLTSFFIQLITAFLWFGKAKKYLISPDFDVASNLGAFLRYSLSGHLSVVINFFNYRFDLYLIAFFWTKSEVGLYSLSVNLAQFIWLVSSPLSTVLLPYISSERNATERKKIFKVYSKINCSFAIIGSLLLLAVAPIIPFIYGATFIESILPFKVLLLGTLFSAFTRPFATYLAAIDLIKINLMATSIGFVVTVALDFMLIPKYGIIGASFATLATYISIFLVVYGLGLTRSEFKLQNYFIITKSDLMFFYQKIMRRADQ